MNDANSNSLAHITLRWMVSEIIRHKCPIKFDDRELKKLGIPEMDNPFLEIPSNVPERTLEAEEMAEKMLQEDKTHALMPLRDPFVSNRAWWILEYLPLSSQTHGSSFLAKQLGLNVSFNRGRGRQLLPSTGEIVLHISVKKRRDQIDYKPRLRYDRKRKVKRIVEAYEKPKPRCDRCHEELECGHCQEKCDRCHEKCGHCHKKCVDRHEKCDRTCRYLFTFSITPYKIADQNLSCLVRRFWSGLSRKMPSGMADNIPGNLEDKPIKIYYTL